MSISDHAPHQRIISGRETATDRQWLLMLDDALKEIDADAFVSAGMSTDRTMEFLGLIALTDRVARS